MAIYFKTNTPKDLLAAYKKAIDDGHVTTWEYDSDGDFTHKEGEWNQKAWLRPRIQESEALAINFLAPQDTETSSEIYAIYHGRFVESMLNHCDKLFSEAVATSMPDDGDII